MQGAERMQIFLKPHRIVLIALALAAVAAAVIWGRWDWLGETKYQVLILKGVWLSMRAARRWLRPGTGRSQWSRPTTPRSIPFSSRTRKQRASP